MKIDEFLDTLSEINPQAQFPSDMKEAIIGYVERFGMSPVVLLDRSKCIEVLEQEMSHEEAEEFFEFNTIGSWIGAEETPCFATLISSE